MHEKPKRKRSPIRRWLLVGLALVAGTVLAVWMDFEPVDTRVGAGDQPPPTRTAPTLDDLAAGKLAIVDLAWPLSDKSAYWPGDNYKPFELHTIATLEKDGVLSKAFSTPEHLGTHLDAPNHFEAGKPSVDQIPAERFFAEGVVVDVSGKASADADYRLSLDDLHAWEQAHGRIPPGAVVLADTGWSKFWSNLDRYQNRDVMSRLHFPGFSAEAVEFLIDERGVRGVGIDTLSVDHGLSRDFPVHHLLGKAERYGLENLAHLDKLPPRGFWLFVAPIKIETGSGGPVRVFAILPAGAGENGPSRAPKAAGEN
jgi:kynurenine formamidase